MSVHSRCNLQSICTVRCLTLKTVGKIYEIRSRPTLVPSRLRVLACVKFLSLTCETLRPPVLRLRIPTYLILKLNLCCVRLRAPSSYTYSSTLTIGVLTYY